MEGAGDIAEQPGRPAEAHARLPIRHRREVLITHREIPSLDERDRIEISVGTKAYQRNFCGSVQRGRSLGRFHIESPRIASFAVPEMLNGLEVWFCDACSLSEDEAVRQYGDFSLSIIGVKNGPLGRRLRHARTPADVMGLDLRISPARARERAGRGFGHARRRWRSARLWSGLVSSGRRSAA